MIRKETWFFLAIFAVLLVSTWYWQRTKQEADARVTPTPAAQSVFNVSPDTLQSVQIGDDQGRLVALERNTSGGWKLTTPPSEAVDTQRVDAAISALAGLNSLSVLNPAPAAAEIGLAPAMHTITATVNGGKQVVAQVGKLTLTQSGYYVQVGQGPMWVVSKYSLDTLLELLATPPLPPTPTPDASSTPGVTATPVN